MTIVAIVLAALIALAGGGWLIYATVKRKKANTPAKKWPALEWVFSKKYNIYVSRTPKTQWISEEQIDEWCFELVTFWKQHTEETKILKTLDKWGVSMNDVKEFVHNNTFGYTELKPRMCHVSTIPKNEAETPEGIKHKVSSLFLHEVSHAIAYAAGHEPHTHHKLFVDLKLGH